MGKDSVTASSKGAKVIPRTTFDSILLLTNRSTFSEKWRNYQSSTSVVTDEKIDQLQNSGILAFGQSKKLTTLIVAKVDGDKTGEKDLLTEKLAELDKSSINDFFKVCVDGDFSKEQLIDLAKYIESQEYMLTLCTNNSETKEAIKTTDLASELKELNLRSTSIWYHEDEALDLAYASRFLGGKIGKVNSKFLELNLIKTSELSNTEETVLESKNCNYYAYERKKYKFTKQGVTASGEDIKSVAGEKWITVSSIESIYSVLIKEDNVSFNRQDMKRINVSLKNVLKAAQDQEIINEHIGDEKSFFYEIVKDRKQNLIEIKVDYLEAGGVKWVSLSFTAHRDSNQLKIVKEGSTNES